MYMLEFSKDLKHFQWTKVNIACTGPRAFHSSASTTEKEYFEKIYTYAFNNVNECLEKIFN